MKILVFDDGNIGNFVQSYGIARNFRDSEISIVYFEFKGPYYYLYRRKGRYSILPKILNIFCFLGLYKTGKFFLKKFLKNYNEKINGKYDFIINAGSYLASINLILSKTIKAKSIQIMLPSLIPLRKFDFLVIPYHDYLRIKKKNLKNLIITIGSPNVIEEKELLKESLKLEKFIGGKKREMIGVLIGGNDQNYKIDIQWVNLILSELKKIEDKFDFLFTSSKRTDKEVVKYLKSEVEKISNVKYFEIPGEQSFSFYKGILGLSDIILVSEDSINMIFESLTAGKKIFIIGVKRKKKKLIFDFTIEKIVKEGYAEYIPFEEVNNLSSKISLYPKNVKILNEAKECVQKILEKLN